MALGMNAAGVGLLSTAEVRGRDPVRMIRRRPIVSCEKPRDMERYWSMARQVVSGSTSLEGRQG